MSYFILEFSFHIKASNHQVKWETLKFRKYKMVSRKIYDPLNSPMLGVYVCLQKHCIMSALKSMMVVTEKSNQFNVFITN